MPKKVNTADFVLRAKAVHGNSYDYTGAVYVNARSKIQVRCSVHGVFEQAPLNHLQGQGCPMCAGRGVDWTVRFQQVHGTQYDYSKVQYVDYKKPVCIVCKEHGAFYQTPDNHYRGQQGCPQCKGAKIRKAKQMPFSVFLERARAVHKDKYVYEALQFSNVLTGVVTAVCPKHGPFTQNPVNHLAGKEGCTRCNNMKSSAEDAIAQYLSTFTQVESRNRTLLKPKELDIYLPEKALAIEYSGMYWHSHFDAESERKDKKKHVEKYLACAAQGVRLLTIYETEWLERPQALRRLLRNAIGKGRGKLMARKCTLDKVDIAQARAFYETYHPQGGAGNGEHYGLFWGTKLVACMRFSYGNNDRGAGAQSRVWTLSRYATRVTVAGAASRLLKAFVAEHHPEAIKSFSDNRYFSGGMYQQLGFVLEADVLPDYQVWSTKTGLRPKSHYQRRLLPKRLEEHGVVEAFDPETDPRTEAEVTYLMGCGRIYDCGKKKWLWAPAQSDINQVSGFSGAPDRPD